ncbi:MAG: hypothetical protein RIC15_05500, partial [Vicingaceae bacterium]
MCGICGYLKRGALVDETLIAKMTVELSHRGPDASGFYSDERIELGHRRLKVLDIAPILTVKWLITVVADV